jgi:hypothetical protein
VYTRVYIYTLCVCSVYLHMYGIVSVCYRCSMVWYEWQIADGSWKMADGHGMV